MYVNQPRSYQPRQIRVGRANNPRQIGQQPSMTSMTYRGMPMSAGRSMTHINPVHQGGRVFGSQPYGVQQQMNRNSQACLPTAFANGGQRTRSTPQGNVVSTQQQQRPGNMVTMQQQPGNELVQAYPAAAIPDELKNNPNVQYIRMNWEDILGGKNGMQGLQVSMSPQNPENPNSNRQIRIGMGGADAKPADGSTPLRIVSFQPVENFPGMVTPTTPSPDQPKFRVLTQPQQVSPQGWNNGNCNNYGTLRR